MQAGVSQLGKTVSGDRPGTRQAVVARRRDVVYDGWRLACVASWVLGMGVAGRGMVGREILCGAIRLYKNGMSMQRVVS